MTSISARGWTWIGGILFSLTVWVGVIYWLAVRYEALQAFLQRVGLGG